MRSLALLAAAFGLAGCALRPPVLADASAVELTQTPFHAQQTYQCGPAALAMLLGASGVEVTPDALVDQVYLPGREGSLQVELLATTRRHGRLPVRVSGWNGLRSALAEGQPVLVLQNLGLRRWPTWHYAVVIGLSPQTDEVILRSGGERRLLLSARRFLQTWEDAGAWGFVAAAPAAPPAYAQARDWIEAAAALERVGQGAAQLQALEAATQRWPQEALAWQALGNARYAAGVLGAAAAAYRQALAVEPRPDSYHNLALVLSAQGCAVQAQAALQAGLALPEAQVWRARLLKTLDEVTQAPAKACTP